MKSRRIPTLLDTREVSPHRRSDISEGLRTEALIAGAKAAATQKQIRLSDSTRMAEEQTRRAVERMATMETQLQQSRTYSNELEYLLEQKVRSCQRLEIQNTELQDRNVSLRDDVNNLKEKTWDSEALTMRAGILERELVATRNALECSRTESNEKVMQLQQRIEGNTDTHQNDLLKWEVMDIQSKKQLSALQERTSHTEILETELSDLKGKCSDLHEALQREKGLRVSAELRTNEVLQEISKLNNDISLLKTRVIESDRHVISLQKHLSDVNQARQFAEEALYKQDALITASRVQDTTSTPIWMNGTRRPNQRALSPTRIPKSRSMSPVIEFGH